MENAVAEVEIRKHALLVFLVSLGGGLPVTELLHDKGRVYELEDLEEEERDERRQLPALYRKQNETLRAHLHESMLHRAEGVDQTFELGRARKSYEGVPKLYV